MRVFSDIEWWTKQNESKFLQTAVELATYARYFAHGRWSFLGQGDECKMIRNQRSRAKGETERVRLQDAGIIPNERTLSFLGKGSFHM